MNSTQLANFRDEYIKIARKEKKKKDQRTFPISRLLKNEIAHGAFAGTKGLLAGTAAGGLLGGTKGALLGGGLGGLSAAVSNAISSRALLGRSRTKQKGVGESEKKILKALRADKSSRKGSTNPISRAITSVPGAAALGSIPGLIATTALLGSKGVLGKKGLKAFKSLPKAKKKELLGSLGIAGGIAGIGAGTGALFTSGGRIIHARGSRGENRVGRKKSYSQGMFLDDTAQTKILKALKKAKD